MSVRFVLAPQAALDLVEIWRYIKEQTSLTIADRVESAIREKMGFLVGTSGAGHSRKDLADEDVKFFPVYSYLKEAKTPGRPPRHLYRLSGTAREWARAEIRAAQERRFWKPTEYEV
jgi:plasmid stabilization system protein ParE